MKLLDLFCGAGGAAMGYHQAGFDVTGVDIAPQKHYPFEFIQGDALTFLESGGWCGFDAIHASPPCQGYSIMNNLPWLAGKERAYLIGPIRERLEATGLRYVIENVMGARWGAKGLVKRGLEAHGMQAGWLCGTMFGLPFYRHRLFEANWFWMQPGHPKHHSTQKMIYPEGAPGSRGIHKPEDVALVKGRQRDPFHDKDGKSIIGPGNLGKGTRLAARQQGNGAQAVPFNDRNAGIGHANGWRLAAEAMGIDWMKREELTQAIPPAYTRFVGEQLLKQQRRAA